MAPKVMKKSTKPPPPIVEKVISKSKKKKDYSSFSLYLFKLLRSVNRGKESQNLKISRHSMLIMNNFINDMLEKIAAEAGRLAAHSKRNTMSSREIFSATKLLMPKELANHAIAEGMNALAKYQRSRQMMQGSKN